jgi:hypothetical protein
MAKSRKSIKKRSTKRVSRKVVRKGGDKKQLSILLIVLALLVFALAAMAMS